MPRLVLRVAFCACLLSCFAYGQSTVRVAPDPGMLYVHDAKGQLVGALTPVPTSRGDVDGLVRLEISGDNAGIVYLPVGYFEGGLSWVSAGPYYETADCTGTGYAVVQRSVTGTIGMVGMGSILHVGSSDPAAATQRYLKSSAVTQVDGTIGCRSDSTLWATAIELKAVGQLDEMFARPFTIEPGGGTAGSKPRAVRQ